MIKSLNFPNLDTCRRVAHFIVRVQIFVNFGTLRNHVTALLWNAKSLARKLVL